jgi:hypothetical protein
MLLASPQPGSATFGGMDATPDAGFFVTLY